MSEDRPVAWSITVRITDHGRWLPDEPLAAARLIAAVNAWRKPDDPKPKVFRDYDGNTCLRVLIDGERATLDPGEHLVRIELPRSTEWSSAAPEQLAELFPASWGEAA